MASLLLVENNNIKIKFDTINKTLIFCDNNGYSYNLSFDEKNILDSATGIHANKKINNQIKQIQQILDNIQNTGKIGPMGPKGSIGPTGDKGGKGDKGDPGNNLNINYILFDEIELYKIKNIDENKIALTKKNLILYIYKNSKWNIIGSIKGDKGLKGDNGGKGNKGDKGDKGDNIKIDLIINDEKELLMLDESVKFVLIKDKLDLYYNKNNIWQKIGNLKGKKGDIGSEGSEGKQGNSIKFDYIFQNETEMIKSEINPNINEIVLFLNSSELYIWNDNWKKIGKLNYKISNYSKQFIFNADFIDCLNNYENINNKKLRIIKFNELNNVDFWINQENYKVNILNKGLYKIKYNICWNIKGDDFQKSKFLKSGVLIFVYNNNNLIPNSVKLFKGYPITNSCQHEFIIKNDSKLELTFIIHLIEINSKIFVNTYSEGCFLEIEKI